MRMEKRCPKEWYSLTRSAGSLIQRELLFFEIAGSHPQIATMLEAILFPEILKVPLQPSPVRLDRFLIQHFPQTSRQFWKQHLQEIVEIESFHPQKGNFLYGGEILKFKIRTWELDPFLAPDPSLSIPILHEDPSFLIVDKPPLMAVHPLKREEKGTLIQGVIARYPEVARAGISRREGGLVHRLDFETSGLLLIARTPKAHAALRRQFEEREVEKEYLALVAGHIPNSFKNRFTQYFRFAIETPLFHDPKNKKKMKACLPGIFVPHNTHLQEATSLVTIEKNFRDFTLVRVQILTGVRHQIRVHLASLGFPLVADPLYGKNRPTLGLGRFFLHATRLKFRHPESNHWVEYRSFLPDDLAHTLQQLE